MHCKILDQEELQQRGKWEKKEAKTQDSNNKWYQYNHQFKTEYKDWKWGLMKFLKIDNKKGQQSQCLPQPQQ